MRIKLGRQSAHRGDWNNPARGGDVDPGHRFQYLIECLRASGFDVLRRDHGRDGGRSGDGLGIARSDARHAFVATEYLFNVFFCGIGANRSQSEGAGDDGHRRGSRTQRHGTEIP